MENPQNRRCQRQSNHKPLKNNNFRAGSLFDGCLITGAGGLAIVPNLGCAKGGVYLIGNRQNRRRRGQGNRKPLKNNNFRAGSLFDGCLIAGRRKPPEGCA